MTTRAVRGTHSIRDIGDCRRRWLAAARTFDTHGTTHDNAHETATEGSTQKKTIAHNKETCIMAAHL